MGKKDTGKRGKKAAKRSSKKKAAAPAAPSPTLQCTVNAVPASGTSTSKSYAFEDGATVADACEALGLTTAKRNLFLDGKPAAPDAKLSAGCTVSVEERAQGS